MKYKFGKLKKKILLQVAVIAAIGFVIVLIVQAFLVDGFLTPYLLGTFDTSQPILEFNEAQIMEFTEILSRGQAAFVITVGLLVLLVAIFGVSLMRMTKYFRETSGGVNKLLNEDDEKITLPAELDFMEAKLNSVKAALEKREHDAREAEQRKNDLVVYLAHDIRTPLTTVIGYLNLLNEAPDMPAGERSKYVGITLDNALRLEELVDEFFEITRFNAQDIRLDVRRIDLALMLRQMAEEFYPILRPQGKGIVINADGRPAVYGDADKLARVFRNILKNAAIFSNDHTAIKVEIGTDGENMRIVFRNTGIPIPEGKLDAIFDKFYRLDESRSAKTGGAGLGLAIAKEIVMAHNGRIYVESNGGDTAFTVLLPDAPCER